MDEAANNIVPLTGSPLSRRSRENISANITSFNAFINEQKTFNAQKTRADDYQNVLIQGGQSSVTSLQNQLDGISRELATLSQNVNTISQTVQQQGAAEQFRLRSEQENQKRLAERRVVIGKENELEQRIQSSLAAPIVAVQGKVSDLFSRVESAFTTLFLGWLGNSVIEYLRAQSTGDIDKLNQIKGNILKGLAVGVGSLFAVKAGLSLVGRAIGAVTGGVTSLIAKLATAPFKLIGAGIRTLGSGAIKPPPTPTPGAKPGGKLGGGLSSGLVGLAFSGIDFLQRKGEGQTNLQAGAGAGGSFLGAEVGARLGSKLPGPLKLPGMLLGGIGGYMAGGAGADILTGANQPKAESTSPKIAPTTPTPSSKPSPAAATPAPTPTPAATPSAPMMPQASNLTMNVNNSAPVVTNQTEVNFGSGTTATQTSSQSFPDYSSIFSKPGETSAPEMKPAAQITPPPKNTNKASALPEVQPNVIVATDNNASSKITPPAAPPANPDVPAISSSNPDNFYILYSQLNYNVVV